MLGVEPSLSAMLGRDCLLLATGALYASGALASSVGDGVTLCAKGGAIGPRRRRSGKRSVVGCTPSQVRRPRRVLLAGEGSTARVPKVVLGRAG